MTVFDVLALGWFWASSRCAPRCSAGSPDNELRFLDRWADLGRSYLDALEVPGREATHSARCKEGDRMPEPRDPGQLCEKCILALY